ncbi:MAG: 50S ribosomal protein L29 [Cyanobacteria bacterium]|nr:50S ribosomal protein L29 [Cyanobacteriota bacterium]
MKITELRNLKADELLKELEASQKTLFEARFKKSLNQLENTAVFRTQRHKIAQIKTILREQERAN